MWCRLREIQDSQSFGTWNLEGTAPRSRDSLFLLAVGCGSPNITVAAVVVGKGREPDSSVAETPVSQPPLILTHFQARLPALPLRLRILNILQINFFSFLSLPKLVSVACNQEPWLIHYVEANCVWLYFPEMVSPICIPSYVLSSSMVSVLQWEVAVCVPAP